jgi:hypothetical protein
LNISSFTFEGCEKQCLGASKQMVREREKERESERETGL